jgi:peptide chain release factor 1
MACPRWRDPDRLRRLGKEFAELGEIVLPYRAYREALGHAEEAGAMAAGEADPEMAAFLREEAVAAAGKAEELRARLEELLVPKDPNEGKDVLVEIRAGAGGQEAALWAGELFEMYRHLAERRRWKTEVLSASPSDLGGFKEAVLEVRGRRLPSPEARVRGSSVQRARDRVERAITPRPRRWPLEAERSRSRSDPRPGIEVFRSSGPGGQSVHTDSAVRIVHLPSGIKVECQEERSQLQNREKAMRYLRARLLRQAQEEAAAKEAASRRSQVGTGERAEKIRTYNFPENRVTDHRVKLTLHRLQDVLAGDLDEFTDALLAAERAQQLAEPEHGSQDEPTNEKG